MQATTKQIGVSEPIKAELERRKGILSRRSGKKVNFDFVLRDLLRWN